MKCSKKLKKENHILSITLCFYSTKIGENYLTLEKEKTDCCAGKKLVSSVENDILKSLITFW